MSKRYMDFAPARPVKVVKKPITTVKMATKPAPVKPSRATVSVPKPKPVVSPAPKPQPAKTAPALGVIEEVNSFNSPNSVPKRPLGTPAHFNTTKSTVAAAKSQKIGNQQKPATIPTKPVEKPVEKAKPDTYKTPKTPFINTDKVKKRPLSKNVYRKEVSIPAEEPKGPVTIITKPEKDSRISLVVTIIITIILGAVAGTIAFLLLPK